MSDLIRTGVEEYIARDDDSDPSELNTQVVDGDLDEIESRLANVEDQLELLRLENVEEGQLEEMIRLDRVSRKQLYLRYLTPVENHVSSAG